MLCGYSPTTKEALGISLIRYELDASLLFYQRSISKETSITRLQFVEHQTPTYHHWFSECCVVPLRHSESGSFMWRHWPATTSVSAMPRANHYSYRRQPSFLIRSEIGCYSDKNRPKLVGPLNSTLGTGYMQLRSLSITMCALWRINSVDHCSHVFLPQGAK